jgi:tetratricopeptide (TPR) repeat protein
MNLANAYYSRIRGERAENIEQAITSYQQALQVFTRQAFPENWARTQMNLANAYCDRIRGERAENIEQAITSYQQALQVFTPQAFPEDWARTQHNLANAYRDRVRGEETENLKQAIALYKEASQVFTREAYPYKWAENRGELAEAFLKRASLTNDYSDLDTAITLLQTALEVAVNGSPDFIDSQYRLGNALSRRYEYSQNPDDLKSALQAYKTALDAISVEHYDRKQIWQALPETQSILGSRLIRDGQWQEGLQLLLNSVRQLSTGEDRLAHANALFQTGRAQEILLNKDEARLYYRDALRLYQDLQDSLGIAKSYHGLGGVLVSRGNLKKGMTQLVEARKIYHDLGKLDKVEEVEKLYQVAEQVMQEQNAIEGVY